MLYSPLEMRPIGVSFAFEQPMKPVLPNILRKIYFPFFRCRVESVFNKVIVDLFVNMKSSNIFVYFNEGFGQPLS